MDSSVSLGLFCVIWALGASMLVPALVVRMPMLWITILSLAMIVAHNLLDAIRPQALGSLAWAWMILHARGDIVLPLGIRQFVLFPLIPLVGVMAAGYAFGQLYLLDREWRRKLIARIGLGLTVAFIVLRLTNLYGNPLAGLGGVSQGDWYPQPTLEKTADVEKYPPSLQFLLMTIGPSLLLLAALDRDHRRKAGEVSVVVRQYGWGVDQRRDDLVASKA